MVTHKKINHQGFKTFSLGLLNIRSMNTGWDKFQESMDTNDPDILCLSETWLYPNTDIEPFDFVRKVYIQRTFTLKHNLLTTYINCMSNATLYLSSCSFSSIKIIVSYLLGLPIFSRALYFLVSLLASSLFRITLLSKWLI